MGQDLLIIIRVARKLTAIELRTALLPRSPPCDLTVIQLITSSGKVSFTQYFVCVFYFLMRSWLRH
jgi:hypothetical protein